MSLFWFLLSGFSPRAILTNHIYTFPLKSCIIWIVQSCYFLTVTVTRDSLSNCNCDDIQTTTRPKQNTNGVRGQTLSGGQASKNACSKAGCRLLVSRAVCRRVPASTTRDSRGSQDDSRRSRLEARQRLELEEKALETPMAG